VIRNKGVFDFQPIKVKAFGLFLLVWLVYSILSINWAIDKTSALKHVVFLFLSVSVIIFSIIYFDSVDDLHTVSIIWLVFLGVTLLIGIFETISGDHLSVSRYFQVELEYFKYTPTAVFYNPNDFATFLSLSAPFLLSFFFFSKKILYRLIFLVSFFALLYVLISTGSRANFIAIFLEIVFFVIVFFTFQTNRKEIYILITVSLMALLLFPKKLAEKVNFVIRNIQSVLSQLTAESHSMGERLNLARNGLLFLLSTWGFGVGAGNVEVWMKTRAQYNTGNKINIHNWFLEVLVNYGIFIFVGYLILLVSMFYKVYSQLRTHRDDHKMKVLGVAILGSLIGFLFASLSPSSIMAFRPHWMIYALGLSYINIGLNKAQREEQQIQKA